MSRVPDQSATPVVQTEHLRTRRTKPRVLLADDHAALLDAVRRLLEPSYDVVGTVADGTALVAAALSLVPDLILSDIGMPGLNGLDAVAEVTGCLPGVRVVLYTVDGDADTAAEARRRGASAVVVKTAPAATLLRVLEAVLEDPREGAPR